MSAPAPRGEAPPEPASVTAARQLADEARRDRAAGGHPRRASTRRRWPVLALPTR